MSSLTNYGVGAHSAEYASAFPAVPRQSGVSTFTYGSPTGAAAATIVRFVTKEKDAPKPTSPAAADAAAEAVAVTYDNESRIVSSSLGPSADVDAAGLRKAAVSAIGKLRSLKIKAASIELPVVEGIPAGIVADIMVQASLLTNFAFDRYLTLESKKASLIDSLTFVPSAAGGDAEGKAAHTASVLADATIFARDMVNERADGEKQWRNVVRT
jgi:leucyl aminopeptidase